MFRSKCKTNPPESDGRFQQQYQAARINETARNTHDQRHGQKADGDGAGINRHPFERIEETILGMVRKAENKIPKETAESEQHNPLGPLGRIRIYHAIHDEKKSQTGAGKRSGKGSGIGEAADGVFQEEVAFEMQNHADQPDQNSGPPDPDDR